MQPDIWRYFLEISQIPRPSKKEARIINYLLNFAKENKLACKQDEAGNLVISKKATEGFNHAGSIILQSHVDMVCEKNRDVNHDFDNDPIIPRVDGQWVKASGTTLGADNGIGVATQLAILASDNINHGPLECLFTVDEETGLTGAFNLGEGMLTGKTLLNLDSEDEGDIFIGCAGGIDTIGYLDTDLELTPSNSFAFTFYVSGLKGGHSGDDIHRGLGNANKILSRFMSRATNELDFRLSTLDGGNLRNAIAREASATGVVPFSKKEEIRVMANLLFAEIQDEIGAIEPGFKINLESETLPRQVFTKALHNRVINILQGLPHGVISMSMAMPGLVETSTNLASVKIKDNKVVITTSQRSSIETAKIEIANTVKSVMQLGSATVWQSDGYPGWKPNTSSRILEIATSSYRDLFGKSPGIKDIHAGLECGLFLKKYPALDMISIGPTIKGAHSPNERLEIESVQKFWDFLLEILKRA